MKIGIITFWESTDNYGQVLQAYALQKVLKDLGHEPFQIRYSLKASQSQKHQSSIFKKIIKVLLVYPLFTSYRSKKAKQEDNIWYALIEEKNKVRRFPEFRNQYILNSKKIYNSIDELRADPPQADCYITGSDQVWTMLLNNEGNKAYYLDFGNPQTKRISYAASFGRSVYPFELLPELRNLLQKFCAISVREQEGVEICNSINLYAEKVLDPTLLLRKTCYQKFCTNVQKRGLYVYSINIKTSKEIYWDEIQRYALRNKMSITVTTSSGNFPGREIFDNVEYFYATIPEWLQTIESASLVVTTSFHGVVFCLLMKTNFVYIPLQSKGAKGNGRVESLLDIVGAQDKICRAYKDFEKCASVYLNWDEIEKNIEYYRNKSLYFLSNALI